MRQVVLILSVASVAALEAGEPERAGELLGGEMGEKDDGPCDHVVAAALLSAHARRCDELGIAWSCQAEVPRDVGLTPVEVGMLFSNLLGNALSAAGGMRRGRALRARDGPREPRLSCRARGELLRAGRARAKEAPGGTRCPSTAGAARSWPRSRATTTAR